MIAVIGGGGHVRGMVGRLRELKARQDKATERLSAAPADLPDINPSGCGVPDGGPSWFSSTAPPRRAAAETAARMCVGGRTLQSHPLPRYPPEPVGQAQNLVEWS